MLEQNFFRITDLDSLVENITSPISKDIESLKIFLYSALMSTQPDGVPTILHNSSQFCFHHLV